MRVQEKRKLVSCPVCGSTRVERAIMAPQIVSKKGRDKRLPSQLLRRQLLKLPRRHPRLY